MPSLEPILESWSDLSRLRHSQFFGGEKADVAFDRSRHGRGQTAVPAPNAEALFTQSNARVLLGQAANGMLRFVAMPKQVFPAPTGAGDFGLGPGMYHHFDTVMYVGNLTFRLKIDGQDDPIVTASSYDPMSGICGDTRYAGDFLPVSTASNDGLFLTLTSYAPVAPDADASALAPAPLPGPAGAFYVLHVRNNGSAPVRGKVVLRCSDLLLGHYEDAQPDRRAIARPNVSLRQNTLILSEAWGAAGIQLHDGTWTRLAAPFEAEVTFSLAPGAERSFVANVALGATYDDVIPTIFALHMRPPLTWLKATAAFWRERLGEVAVSAEGATDEALCSRDIYVRGLIDNFNCLQTDAEGHLLAHWQGAPSHGYGTVWGIDVEPTAVSIVHLCPELTYAALRFFLWRSRAPRGTPDHSLPILVAPIIIARQWLQVTGEVERLARDAEVMSGLRSIVADVMALKAPNDVLFPTRYASDGAVGRKYDYGTNVKVWYALESMAYLLERTGDTHGATSLRETTEALREDIARRMTGSGPFGPQIIGGTNLGEDPGTFYLAESAPGRGAPYYDGEDTSSMLAPTYGIVDFSDDTWIAYHRFARSPWCANFDPEFGALRWSPRGFAAGALDGTAFFSRLAGSITRQEMVEAFRALWDCAVDEVTGSVFWWPHGLEYKRSLTRCSQGQGAFAWHYLKHWLGLEVDAASHTLTVAPRGLLTGVTWRGFRAGPYRFDVLWHEGPTDDDEVEEPAGLPAGIDTGAVSPWQTDGPDERYTMVQVTNHNAEPWIVRIGLRPPDTGAAGTMAWRAGVAAPGATLQMLHAAQEGGEPDSLTETAMVSRVVAATGHDGIVFKRYGPGHLWGHWELDALWDPHAMPLTIRLLVANGTGLDLHGVTVALTCPDPWLAEGRPPRLWEQPGAYAAYAEVDVGALSHLHQEVAPFWVMWPPDLDLVLDGHNEAQIPFHANTQPGPGLTLYARDITESMEALFTATLTGVAENATTIHRRIIIPVKVLPYHPS